VADTKNIDIQRFARLGAVARLKEIEAEAAAIRKAFPGLKRAHTASAPATPAATAKPSKRTRNVSPEVRLAAAERMKAYWAKKKAEQGATAPAVENSPGPKAAPRKKATKTRKKR